MIKNYVVTAWRSIVKNSTFYFINVFGLSVGLTCCLLIGSYLYSELTYDTYPARAKDIYRVGLHVMGNGAVVDYSHTDWGVGPGIQRTYPEVVASTRLTRGFQTYFRYKETVLKEQHIAVVDSNFLQVFSIPLLEGDDRTALVEPNSMVVSKEFARRYFGDDDPVGKMLTFGRDHEMKITGLIDRVPEQSHFNFDAFVSLSSYGKPRESWSNIGVYTYIVLNEHADAKTLEAKLPDLVAKYVVPEVQNDMGVSLAEAQKAVGTFIFSLQPLTRIHLYSHTSAELGANGDIKYVYIFGALAVFILLLACVNFTNLATASSANRSREVGIRKVMGSVRSQLVFQFLTESVLLALGAMAIAYFFVLILLPYFNDLTGKQVLFSFFIQPAVLAVVLVSLMVVGVISGIYPAFFLSSFGILTTLKATTSVQGRRNFLRSGLVIFQFVVSIAMIAATLVVYQQLNYMQSKKLGYDSEQILVVRESYLLRNNEELLKQQLLKDSRVSHASVARNLPGDNELDGTQAYAKDKIENENNSEIHIDIMHVDYDYFATLGLNLASGRNFSRDFPSDSAAVVVNETAAREFGWTPEKAIGKSIVTSGQHEYWIVGVVKDFHYASVRQKVGPLVMMLRSNRGNILVKISTTDIPGFINDLKKQWTSFYPDVPLSYTFLDDAFSSMYFQEERTGRIFSTFSVIALLIAGLGLFGLSAFTAEQRTKEIGIRKVLGASVGQVLIMLSKEFLVLVLVAFIIAVPVVSWAMNLWLQEFAYRVSMSVWVFAGAALACTVLAIVAMGFQSVRAAVRNPVESLRAE